jgi:very-short-patch-repair endonuclease
MRAGWGDLSPSEMHMISTPIRRAAAKRLRANTTPHERTLWRALKELPLDGTHFRRQAPIGPYVADFFCPAAHLIIELDGGHHNEDDTAKRDRERQAWLEREGYRVVRFWNSDITGDLNAVLERIYIELHGSREAEVEPFKHRRRLKRPPSPTPPAPDDAAHRRPWATLPLQGRVRRRRVRFKLPRCHAPRKRGIQYPRR